MRQDINFQSAGLSLAGHLYTPRQAIAAPRSAIVVGHPGTGVKDELLARQCGLSQSSSIQPCLPTPKAPSPTA